MTNAATTREMLSEPTLRRLPWYYAYVCLLRAGGVERVSSTALSRELGVDAAKIAKDLSQLSIRGKTRVGYEVEELESALAQFLGFKVSHAAVMIGAGSLGAALIADEGLSRYGLSITAGFDINPLLVGKLIAGRPIHHIDDLRSRRGDADIAIIAVPVEAAQEAAQACIAAGIKALWNFTPRRLRVPEGVVVQNTSIYSSLAVMYNRLTTREPEQEGGRP